MSSRVSGAEICIFLPLVNASDKIVNPSKYPLLFEQLQQKNSSIITSDSLYDLLNAFSLKDPSKTSIAAITAIADGLQPVNANQYQHWLRADPVAMEVDWAHVFMRGGEDLQLSSDEIELYLQLLNSHLSQDDLQLSAANSQRWYIALSDEVAKQSISMQSFHPANIIGKPIREFLPSAHDVNFWLEQFNEIQMLLHDCELNQARAQNMQETVDALWFWGSGQTPCVDKKNPWQRVVTNHPVAKGLAILTDTSYVEFEDDFVIDMEAAMDAGKGNQLFCFYPAASIEALEKTLEIVEHKILRRYFE